MADTFNFSFFDEEETTVEAPKKDVKKPEKKDKPGKPGKKATPAAAQGFKCPITIVTGYMPPFTLNSDNFAGKEDGVTEAELRTAVERLYPYFQSKATKVSRVSETKALCFLQEGFASTKGDVTVTEKTVAYLGQIKVPLTNFLREDETVIPLEELKAKIIPSIRCQLICGDNGVISILPGSRPTETKDFPLPFTVSVLADRRAEFTVTRDDVVKFCAESAPADTEDGEEDGAGAPAVIGNTATHDQVVGVLKNRFPAFADGLKLYDCVDNNKVTGNVVRFQPSVTITPKAAVEETYPVKGLTVSLLFKKYHPTVEDFGGLNAVNSKQIAGYLREQGEIDYEDGNTYVSKYSKETNTVVIAFKGGTKG